MPTKNKIVYNLIIIFLVHFTSLCHGLASAHIKDCEKVSGKLQPEILINHGHVNKINSVSFSPDGKILASGSDDKTIKLWGIVSGKLLRTLEGHIGSVNSVSFSPDGKILASGSDDKTIKLWDMERKTLIHTIENADSVYLVLFSPDGKTLASSNGNKIKLWDSANGERLFTMQGHIGNINSMSFSPDGKTLLSLDRNTTWGGFLYNTMKLWDINSGKLLFSRAIDFPLVSVSFSPDGKILASAGGRDKTINLWDTANGKLLRSLGDSANSVSFSPDGKILASGDNIIKLWDIGNGKLLRIGKQLAEDGYIFRQYDDHFTSKVRLPGAGRKTSPVRVWKFYASKLGELEAIQNGNAN